MADSTLYNNDCIRIMQTISSASVDLILTDPPYNLGIFMKERDTNLNEMRDNFFAGAGWDNLPFEDWKQSMDAFFGESKRVLKKGGAMLVFMSIIKLETLISIAEHHDFYYKTTGIWHKPNPMPRNMNIHFVNSTEAWVYLINKRKSGTFNNENKLLHDFIEMPAASNGERKCGKHPTQKPEQLMSFFIKVLTNEGDLILDPFMGSGSTGVAAKKNKRNFIGIELSEEYFKIASKRISEVKI